MADISNLDDKAQTYFNELPPLIKEQIMQSSMQVTSKEDLESFYQNILRGGLDTVRPEN